tara:strand:- start:1541 stop:1714 length:174 start_codon:yes stop_codon:yes gene_type:complete
MDIAHWLEVLWSFLAQQEDPDADCLRLLLSLHNSHDLQPPADLIALMMERGLLPKKV